MKPYNFQHLAPDTLEEVIHLLSNHPGEVKIISGGQSLMPVLNFRLAKPDLLLDLKNLKHLNGISISSEGTELGSRVRWIDIEKSMELKDGQPLLHKALSYVAHYQIRNRGTVGGSLANSDPAAELPLLALVLDAKIKVMGSAGIRELKIDDYFQGFMSTSLAKDDVIVALSLPKWPVGRCWGFEEFSRRHGDFAMAACALWFDLSASNKMQNIHLGVIGSNDYPVRLVALEKFLENKVFSSDLLDEAIQLGLKDLHPPVDPQISSAYRLSLISTMIKRSFAQCFAR